MCDDILSWSTLSKLESGPNIQAWKRRGWEREKERQREREGERERETEGQRERDRETEREREREREREKQTEIAFKTFLWLLNTVDQ